MFPSFELFGRQIGLYGVMTIIGALVCALVGSRLLKRYGFDVFDLSLLLLSVGAGIFLGAHILFALTNLGVLIDAFRNIGTLWFDGFWSQLLSAIGGMVFYGGFLGGLAVIPLYCKFDRRVRPAQLFDVYAVLVPLFHVFGRIGCFLGGCCYGIASPFGFTVHGNTLNPAINDVNRLPVQLIESACNLLIFLLILFLFRRRRMTDRLILVYMLVYPAVRFTLEFFRGDEIRGFLFGLSTSQWISLLLFTVSVVCLIIGHYKRSKRSALST